MNEVEAVKSRAEIAAIETLLRKHHGEIYADIWKIGLNLSLRISDLLAIADLDLDRREYNLVAGKSPEYAFTQPGSLPAYRRPIKLPAAFYCKAVTQLTTTTMS